MQKPGNGKVTSNPAAIDCGFDCTYNFTSKATVSFTATADPGSVFVGRPSALSTGSPPACASGRTCSSLARTKYSGTALPAGFYPSRGLLPQVDWGCPADLGYRRQRAGCGGEIGLDGLSPLHEELHRL